MTKQDKESFKGLSNKDSIKHQLELWVKGISVHNPVRDECCPDFSCCGVEIAPMEVREQFVKAVKENDEDVKTALLGMFLGRMLNTV